jgi:hypothetical protein
VADVENFDFAFGIVDAVIDEVWTVYDFTDGRPLPNQATHGGEIE